MVKKIVPINARLYTRTIIALDSVLPNWPKKRKKGNKINTMILLIWYNCKTKYNYEFSGKK